jgi:hypothetical protein
MPPADRADAATLSIGARQPGWRVPMPRDLEIGGEISARIASGRRDRPRRSAGTPVS